ncbi:acyltransferase [Niallia taxi]|uniref:acyltransferase family protein n=1 Tax=Niallia taxi TaxID=2499688 RepID=UPI003172C789
MGIIRLILAVSVVAAHAGSIFGFFTLLGGGVAVEVFFIISGFYMALILNDKYVGKGSYRLFFSNRLLKLYPTYLVVLILTVLISIVSFKLTSDGGFLSLFNLEENSIFSMLFLGLTNLSLLGQDIVMFLHIDNDGMLNFTSNFRDTNSPAYRMLAIPPAWSLSLELMFYLLAPFLVRLNYFKLSVVILISLVLKIYILVGLGLFNDPWTYRFFPTELAYFLTGALCYKLYNALKGWKVGLQKSLGKWCFFLVFGTIIAYGFLPIHDLFKQFIFFVIFVPSLPFIFSWSKSNKRDRFWGELSFPVYISHWTIVSVLTFFNLDRIESAFSAMVIIVAILFSLILNKYVMSPLENFRQSRVKVNKYKVIKEVA